MGKEIRIDWNGQKPEYLEDKYLYAGSKHLDSPLAMPPTQSNFKGSDLDEPRYCSIFGCGKKLSMEELRFGNTCINHQK